MEIQVKVKPNSKKEGVTEVEENLFEVRVNAQPIEGKANIRVIEILSKFFKVPKSKIALVKGQKSKIKKFRIEG